MEDRKEIYSLNSPIMDNAVDQIVVKLYRQKQKHNSRVFLVCGCEPGIGTTTIAINLALSTAAAGWKTLLIDADFRKDLSYKRLGREGQNLNGYLMGHIHSVDTLPTDTNRPNLCYLSSGVPTISPLNLLGSKRMEHLLVDLRDHFDFIIVDAPSPQAAVDACVLTPLVDENILVARWEHTTTKQIQQAHLLLKEAHGRVMGVVVNRIEATSFKRLNRDHAYFIEKRYTNQGSAQIAADPLPEKKAATNVYVAPGTKNTSGSKGGEK